MHKLLLVTLALGLFLKLFDGPLAAQTPVALPTPLPSASAAELQVTQKVTVYPLPGGLDTLPMLNSNSPEKVNDAGILVSTLPPRSGFSPEQNAAFLDYAFQGDFGVFCHHIFQDANPGERLLYLGLVATNPGDKPLKVTLKRGASFLSQPDAPFNKRLPNLISNPGGLLFIGPGDRVASEWLAGKSNLGENLVIEVPAHASALLSSLPINTDVPILPPPLNGRSTLQYFHAEGPVYLSQLAWLAKKQEQAFVAPSLDDYLSLIEAARLAGPHEPSTDFDPAVGIKGGAFKYGRVAGVSPGLSWKGKLWDRERLAERPAPGQKVAYPIASTVIKRFGIDQNQSGNMIRRYPDTPPQSHGNYGVLYDLEIPLHNDTKAFQTYSLALTQPLNPNIPYKSGDSSYTGELVFVYPPRNAPMFRGSVKLSWRDEYKQQQERLTHVSLRNGQESAALEMMTIPPHTHYDLRLQLIYPADVTPPQLLTIERVE